MIWRIGAGAIFACLILAGEARAGDCAGRPGALGTSRTLIVDPAHYRRFGTNQYSETLPLEDHEVVLTFDDGPLPPYTEIVLDALARECVKATFFVVGQMARDFPQLVQREYGEGHTIGTHTEHHPHLNRLPAGYGRKEMAEGIASVQRVLGDAGRAAPFFRFPYLDASPALEAIAWKLGLSVWSTDVHASDWLLVTPEKVTAMAIERLERKKRGMLLLHDIQNRTALAVPAILRELNNRGYRVVHAVPAGSSGPPQELPRQAAVTD
jgi:peptidoglycan-N-acetylglucosamine deacetylase